MQVSKPAALFGSSASALDPSLHGLGYLRNLYARVCTRESMSAEWSEKHTDGGPNDKQEGRCTAYMLTTALHHTQ